MRTATRAGARLIPPTVFAFFSPLSLFFIAAVYGTIEEDRICHSASETFHHQTIFLLSLLIDLLVKGDVTISVGRQVNVSSDGETKKKETAHAAARHSLNEKSRPLAAVPRSPGVCSAGASQPTPLYRTDRINNCGRLWRRHQSGPRKPIMRKKSSSPYVDTYLREVTRRQIRHEADAGAFRGPRTAPT